MGSGALMGVMAKVNMKELTIINTLTQILFGGGGLGKNVVLISLTFIKQHTVSLQSICI